MSWAAQEFKTLDLGDARLNRRGSVRISVCEVHWTFSSSSACSTGVS